jgi:hypothetical protein
VGYVVLVACVYFCGLMADSGKEPQAVIFMKPAHMMGNGALE